MISKKYIAVRKSHIYAVFIVLFAQMSHSMKEWNEKMEGVVQIKLKSKF